MGLKACGQFYLEDGANAFSETEVTTYQSAYNTQLFLVKMAEV